jgi:hypothetical protein
MPQSNSTPHPLLLCAELPLRPLAFAAALGIGLTGANASSAPSPSFPSPPAGATVFARQLGSDALALGVVARPGGAVLVQASVLGRQGNGVPGLGLAFTIAGHTKSAVACGPGCYRATFTPARAPQSVDVTLPGGTRAPWHVQLPAAWPPHDASALVSRAGRVWRSLHSVTFRERLASGTGQAVVSTWRVQAPDRLAYVVEGGWSAVVIGGRRWDRGPSARQWTASAQTPLHQPVPFWVSVRDAHVLGNLTFGGQPAVRVSFFDPGSPAWFTLVLDRKTFRTLDSHMVTNAHFMHDAYSAFNATASITIPH